MTKRIWTGVCTAIVGFAAAAVTAQTTSSPAPQSATSQNDRRITVTGCLKEAPGSAASTTTAGSTTAGTTGTTGAPGTAGATGTTGSTVPAPDTASATAKLILANAVPSTPASSPTSTNEPSTPAPPTGATSTT